MKAILLTMLMTAFFVRDYTDGMNRICIYDSPRGEVAITVPVTKLCPWTIEV